MASKLQLPRGADLKVQYVLPEGLSFENYTAAFKVYDDFGGSVLISVSQTPNGNGSGVSFDAYRIDLFLSKSDIAALGVAEEATEPRVFAFDLFLTSPAAVTSRLHGGAFVVNPVGFPGVSNANEITCTIEGADHTVTIDDTFGLAQLRAILDEAEALVLAAGVDSAYDLATQYGYVGTQLEWTEIVLSVAPNSALAGLYADAAQTSASAAATASDAAVAAQDNAESYASEAGVAAASATAFLSGFLFASTAAGIAGVADNAYFLVKGASDGDTYATLYQRVGSSAVSQGLAIPSQTLVQRLTSVLTTNSDGIFRHQDEEGFVGFQYDPNRGFGVPGGWISATGLGGMQIIPTTGELNLPGLRVVEDSPFLLGVTDEEGFVVWRLGYDGKIKAAPPSVADAVTGIVCGGVMHNSVQITADVIEGPSFIRWHIASDADFVNILASSDPEMPTPRRATLNSFYRVSNVRITSDSLQPYTRYYYAPEVDGLLLTDLAQSFKTAPQPGVATAFSFIIGSCSDWKIGPDAPILTYAAGLSPDFFIQTGDLDYSDIRDNNAMLMRRANLRLSSTYQGYKDIFAVCPLVYVFDDHDAGGGNNGHVDVTTSDGSNYADLVATTRMVYREHVPHYPFLQELEGETDYNKILLTHGFTYGKAAFFVADCKSQQKNGVSVLGHNYGYERYDQLQGFYNYCDTINNSDHNRFFFVSSKGWGGTGGGLGDGWGDFTTDATAVCTKIKTLGMSATILAGDFHANACDDGTYTDYSGGGGVYGPYRLTQIMASPILRTHIPDTGLYSWDGGDGLEGEYGESIFRVTVDTAGHWEAELHAMVNGVGTLIRTYKTRDL